MVFSKLSNILNDINTVLLPRLCFGCNARLYRGEKLLCTLCRNQLPLTGFNFSEENAADRTFYGRVPFEKAAAFLYYSEEGIVKNLIHFLKYRNQPQVGVFLGDWYGQLLREGTLYRNIDLVLPVPLHPRKQRQRGYNQVAGFGQRLAFHLEAEYAGGLLVKTVHTTTQTAKSRIYRWQGSREIFALTDPRALEHKKVLLVDDVITTGATLEACTRVLNTAEGVRIYLAAMALVP